MATDKLVNSFKKLLDNKMWNEKHIPDWHNSIDNQLKFLKNPLLHNQILNSGNSPFRIPNSGIPEILKANKAFSTNDLATMSAMKEFNKISTINNNMGIPSIMQKGDLHHEIQIKEVEINQLKDKINALQQKVEQGQVNTNQIQELKVELKKMQQDKEYLIQNLKEKLENKLNTDIQNAQKELANSLKSADKRIHEYNAQARLIQKHARKLFYLDLWILGGMVVALVIISSMQLPLFDKLGAWSLMLLSFPVLIILTIAITLLRHHKKLLDEVRHYSAEKRQIELYSGLLKASQHAAAGLNDPQKSAEYVQETFTAIRNRILSEQPHSNTAASASEKEDYSVAEIVKGLVDLVAKNDAKK